MPMAAWAPAEWAGWICKKRTDARSAFRWLSRVDLLKAWKQAGYRIEMVYLRLRSAHLPLRRIAARVRQGGHYVLRVDVVRRFSRDWRNFQRIYRPLADSWAVYENSGHAPRLLEKSRALRRAVKDAQKTARMYGTPLYVWENGKVVAKKP